MLNSAPLLIDKPVGPSSFTVIRCLRKRYTDETGRPAPKMGHAGTLDPLASGLLIIGVGSGTKMLRHYVGLNKEYRADIILGEERTTGDREGTIVREEPAPDIAAAAIAEVLSGMVGTLRLPVPAYSAVKQGGVPLYKKARRASALGGTLTIPIRDMEVYQASLLTGPRQRRQRLIFTVQFLVGSGTYIRSLATETGRRLGSLATLAALRRLKVGEFKIADANTIDSVIMPIQNH